MIDLTLNESTLDSAATVAKDRGISIPTFAMMRDPSLIPAEGRRAALSQVIKIHQSAEQPENAFTTVKYRDLWFWIDDRDFKSKRTFAFLMILFSLTETGGKEGLPLVTIPAS